MSARSRRCAPCAVLSFLLLATWLAGGPAADDPLASVSEGCLLSGCHGAVEKIHHGGPALACVDCHLGDPHQRRSIKCKTV